MKWLQDFPLWNLFSLAASLSNAPAGFRQPKVKPKGPWCLVLMTSVEVRLHGDSLLWCDEGAHSASMSPSAIIQHLWSHVPSSLSLWNCCLSSLVWLTSPEWTVRWLPCCVIYSFRNHSKMHICSSEVNSVLLSKGDASATQKQREAALVSFPMLWTQETFVQILGPSNVLIGSSSLRTWALSHHMPPKNLKLPMPGTEPRTVCATIKPLPSLLNSLEEEQSSRSTRNFLHLGFG